MEVLSFPHDILTQDDSDFSEAPYQLYDVYLFLVIFHAFVEQLFTLVLSQTLEEAVAKAAVKEVQFD